MSTEDEKVADTLNETAEILRGILSRMGYDLEVQVKEQDSRVLLDIVGDAGGELIGEKGQTLDALQYLVSRIMSRAHNFKQPIVIDNGGYRQRRNEALQQMAQELREKCVSSGKVLAVNPMSAHDRRIIHMALKEVPDVTTQSEGDGPYRRVLIVPTKD